MPELTGMATRRDLRQHRLGRGLRHDGKSRAHRYVVDEKQKRLTDAR